MTDQEPLMGECLKCGNNFTLSNSRALDEFMKLERKIIELEEKLKVAVEALKFYAYKANDFTTIEEDEYHFDVDTGDKAKEALKKIGNK